MSPRSHDLRFVAMSIWPAADFPLTISDTRIASEEKHHRSYSCYENLPAELGEVFSQLNICFDGTLGVAAKSEFRTDRRPYQQVFNDEQRKIVEKAFGRETELHGYRF
jgi:hypothetical protein